MGTKKSEKIELKALEIRKLSIEIESITPLLQQRWSEKSLEKIGGTLVGEDTKSKKNRDKRDPEKEAADRAHSLGKGRYGIPVMAIKGALISAAHKDIGIEKTLIRSNLFVEIDGADPRCGTPLVEIKTKGYEVDKRPARNANGGPDMRYRPRFDSWKATLRFTYVADRISAEQIATLVQRAGFTCGVGELRPERCGGELGRWALVEK